MVKEKGQPLTRCIKQKGDSDYCKLSDLSELRQIVDLALKRKVKTKYNALAP